MGQSKVILCTDKFMTYIFVGKLSQKNNSREAKIIYFQVIRWIATKWGTSCFENVGTRPLFGGSLPSGQPYTLMIRVWIALKWTDILWNCAKTNQIEAGIVIKIVDCKSKPNS